jgi:hypothetical protein
VTAAADTRGPACGPRGGFATIAVHADARGGPGRDWIRRYPPLAALAAAVALAIYGLPSALNLPQANPGEIAEYAPVPGQSTGAQAGGNFSGLGEAQGGGLAAGEPTPTPTPTPLQATGPGGLPPGTPPGTKLPPPLFQCVGNPPRQTEDPLSPPCVPYFFGNNGGSTYPGVTGTSITVLVYLEGGQIASPGCDNQPSPIGQYVDLNAPPQSGESCRVRGLRAFQAYFNHRYQLYGRQAHLYVYWSNDANGESPQERSAEANDNYNTLHPFAVLPLVFGNTDAYEQTMALHKVMEFVDGSGQYFTNASFQQFAPQLWGYWPTSEEQAAMEADWLCTKIIEPGKVTFSSEFAGGPRKYGLAETTDNLTPEVRRYQDQVASLLKSECGVSFADTVDYPVEGPIVSYSGPKQAAWETYAPPAMARFKQEGITTIIWPGGTDFKMSPAANNAQYFPEWVLGGDSISTDGNLPAAQQNQKEWAQAVVITPATYSGPNGVPPDCSDAYNSVDPGQNVLNQIVVCQYYPMLRELFSGIQVAGPRLTPDNVTQGYHAIPPHPSSSVTEPACFYPANVYTCIKDQTAEFWDPSVSFNTANTNFKGCWRMMQNGRRYLPGQWPAGDTTQQENPDDLCNSAPGALDEESIDTNTG